MEPFNIGDVDDYTGFWYLRCADNDGVYRRSDPRFIACKDIDHDMLACTIGSVAITYLVRGTELQSSVHSPYVSGIIGTYNGKTITWDNGASWTKIGKILLVI